MASTGSIAGHDLFDSMGMRYEDVYGKNEAKEKIVDLAICQIPGVGGTNDRPKVLDVGCGTGFPVSNMLERAQLDVHGIDISSQMIQLAQTRVKGTFTIIDMIQYQPTQDFAAIFMIFAHLQLKYADFHKACFKFAQSLQPGGLLVIGQMPADDYVKKRSDYDASGTWVEDYHAPFMGELLPTFMMTAKGQVEFLESMGLEIIVELTATFQPHDSKCTEEQQQYIIARRLEERPLQQPLPLPT